MLDLFHGAREVSVGTGPAGRIDAGRAAERVHDEAGIIGECRRICGGGCRQRLEARVLAEARAGLVRLGKQGPRSSQQYVITAAGKKAFKAWLVSEPGPDHLRSPLILRVVHAASLTPKQRADLVSSAKASYAAQQDVAEAALARGYGTVHRIRE